MKKILVSSSHFDTLCQDAWKMIEENGYEVIFEPERSFPDYPVEDLKKRDDLEEIVGHLIGLDDYHDERKYELMPNLRCVAKFGVGVDNISSPLATKHGVAVLNAPGQNSNSVAELTIGMMIDILRNITPLHKAMKEGCWPRALGTEVKGKTVGLLGFGAIARLVAKKLQAFDCHVIAYDLYPNLKAAEELGVTMVGSMDEVIANCDILSLHIPATKDTYHLIDAEKIATMRDGAYLLNLARGALVDLDALAEAMLAGKIRGAGLDAFEVEPLPLDAPIMKCENVVLTPHTGAETYEAYRNVSMTTVSDILRVLRGEEPIYWVNRP